MELSIEVIYHCSGTFSFTATDAEQIMEQSDEKLHSFLPQEMTNDDGFFSHIYLGSSNGNADDTTGNISVLYTCGGHFTVNLSTKGNNVYEQDIRDKVREHIGDNPTHFVYSWEPIQNHNENGTDGE